MARPIPEDAPVIRADLPCRSFWPVPPIFDQSACNTSWHRLWDIVLKGCAVYQHLVHLAARV